MKRIIALAAAALLCVGAQAATGHHAAKVGASPAKATQAHKGGKKALAHKHGASKHAAKAQRKSGHKHA